MPCVLQDYYKLSGQGVPKAHVQQMEQLLHDPKCSLEEVLEHMLPGS
jgi:hypothetical protein